VLLLHAWKSTQVLLHIGASLDLEINQMDVKTAFFHGYLEEEVYMEQPEGMKEPGQRRLGMLYAQGLCYGLDASLCRPGTFIYIMLCWR